MTYLVILLILPAGYYTLTYGISVWKNEKNTLGGIAVMLLAALATIVPIIFIFFRA